jgi:hypothetical protein
MPLLNPQFTTTVVPQRPTDDGMGNTVWADLPAVQAVIWAGGHAAARSVRLSTDRGPQWTAFAQVFLPRGSDVKSGDRIPYQGVFYVLSGVTSGDEVHPFTGNDFGWMVFNVEGHV